MRVRMKFDTMRELIQAAGLRPIDVAHALKVSGGAITRKLTGDRPWFHDELVNVAVLVNTTGRIEVTTDQLVKLVGAKRVKVRGFVA